jgi:hypothetical protein
MKELGINAADEHAVRDFARMVLDRFKKRMTEWVRLFSDDCTIFYNAGHIGPCTRDSADTYSHYELESLPSGSWGYLHFPVTARYARTLGKDCLGMTGKFHTEWGDFHSLKNQAALEFECFRMLSFGFAASVGDQLEPNGRLNSGTYNLIGKVYRQFAEREEWARPAKALTEAALVTSEDPRFEHRIPESILGASQLLEELAVQFDLIDPSMSLNAYRLIFLPDDLIISTEFQNKLDAYVAGGGKVIACARGGLSETGRYPASFGVDYLGKNEVFPDFVMPQADMARQLEEGLEYVIYQQGEKIAPTTAEVILEARAPYFKRSGDWFCSHRYTPSAKGEMYPAATQNGAVILFAHPLFTQYRSNAPFWCKRLIANALDRLLPERLVQHDGPSTMTVSLLDQPEQSRVCAHLLSYVPVRKSATIDIIEERTRLTDVTLALHLPKEPKTARLVPEGKDLEIKDGKICVPEINGYAIVEIGY